MEEWQQAVSEEEMAEDMAGRVKTCLREHGVVGVEEGVGMGVQSEAGEAKGKGEVWEY